MRIRAIDDLVLDTTKVNSVAPGSIQVQVLRRDIICLLCGIRDNMKYFSITFSIDDPAVLYRYCRKQVCAGVSEEIRGKREDAEVVCLADLAKAPLIAETGTNGIPNIFDGWRFDLWDENSLLENKTLLQTIFSNKIHKVTKTSSNQLYQKILDEPGITLQEHIFSDMKVFFETEMSQVLDGTFLCEEQGSGFDYLFRLFYTLRKLNEKNEIFLFDLEFCKLHFLVRVNVFKYISVRFKDLQLIVPEDLI